MSASVFPARAGMSRPFAPQAQSHRSVPRASGDEPAVKPAFEWIVECSPRERG